RHRDLGYGAQRVRARSKKVAREGYLGVGAALALTVAQHPAQVAVEYGRRRRAAHALGLAGALRAGRCGARRVVLWAALVEVSTRGRLAAPAPPRRALRRARSRAP